MADILLDVQSAPSTPAAGQGVVYIDTTSKNLVVKDDAGVVKHGVQTEAGASNNFLTAVNDAGVVSKAQPTDANLSLSDITTNDVSIAKHGFAPKSPNDATKYLDGLGAYSVPASGSGGHTIRENGTDQTARTGLNFIDTDAGAGLVTDDAGGNETEVNLSLYRLESQDHSHASSGLQGGQVSHANLTSVTADQHHNQSHDHSAAGDGQTLTPVTMNLPDVSTNMLGKVVATAITAPATPSAGKGNVYVDSTSKNLAVKDDAGVIKHGVQTQAGSTNNFVTAINDAGVVSIAQPTEANLSTSDITTNDVTTSKHGLAQKAVAPAANRISALGIGNGETTPSWKVLFDETNPTTIGTAAPGTSLSAAHRDHVHDDPANRLIQSLTFIIDGSGSTITTGIKGDLEIPFACTINRVTLLADQSGSIVIDIWKDTYANYPPTVADTITASAKPTITTATKSQDATLTGWTTSIAAGDTLRFNVDSVTTIQRVTLALKVTKT